MIGGDTAKASSGTPYAVGSPSKDSGGGVITRRVSVVVQDTEKQKAETAALGQLKLHHCEMPAEQIDYIVQAASKGLKSLHRGEKVRQQHYHNMYVSSPFIVLTHTRLLFIVQNHYYQLAEALKKEVEGKYGGTWHVIVGRHFGSFVSYEIKW